MPSAGIGRREAGVWSTPKFALYGFHDAISPITTR